MKFSVILNSLTIAAMVGVGAYQIKDARADQQVQSFGEEEVECLRKNVHFEARNQSNLGKKAVAWVTLNRVIDERYPDTICEVVHQGNKNDDGSMVLNQCQFSWYCDGKSDTPPDNQIEQNKWKESETIARSVLREWVLQHFDPTEGADHYHATYANPYWNESGVKTTQIDDHIFYKVSW